MACSYLSATDPMRIIRSSLSQGSVISPTLFNWFLQDCPTSAWIVTSYADDLTLPFIHPDITSEVSTLSARLQSDFTPIYDWSTDNQLFIAPEKSPVTLFSVQSMD